MRQPVRQSAKHIWTVAAFAAVPLGACNCDDELQVVPGAVEGVVCDEESGIGIPGAGIRLESEDGKKRETVSDSQGQYGIDRVMPGNYTVTATKDGQSRRFNVRVESQQPSFLRDTACRGLAGVPDGGTLIGQICNRHTGQLISEAGQRGDAHHHRRRRKLRAHRHPRR
jgi:hypothetical protein